MKPPPAAFGALGGSSTGGWWGCMRIQGQGQPKCASFTH